MSVKSLMQERRRGLETETCSQLSRTSSEPCIQVNHYQFIEDSTSGVSLRRSTTEAVDKRHRVISQAMQMRPVPEAAHLYVLWTMFMSRFHSLRIYQVLFTTTYD